MSSTIEKLKVDHSREIIRMKAKFAQSNGDKNAVGDSLDIYLPISPKHDSEGVDLGSNSRSSPGSAWGENERLLRRRILLLEKDLAVARGVRSGIRAGTPPTPGGRGSDRERERERIRSRREGGGYSSGGTGYGGRTGGTGSSSGSRRASPSLLLSPTSASSQRERGRDRGAGYMRYVTVQYSTIQYSIVQYSAVQCSKVQYITVQYCVLCMCVTAAE